MSQLPPQGPPPAAPPGPPPAYAPPPPPANFKSGKRKTIVLIVAGVVGAGLLGGVVGLALGGGGDDEPKAADAGGNGSGILNPTPVGSVDQPPEPDGEDPAEPDPAEPELPDLPDVPAPDEEPVDTGGDMVSIGAVVIPVPAGWEVQGDPGDYDVNLASEDGTWVYALTGTVEPTADAASLLSGSLDSFIPSDSYSQLEQSAIEPIDPFGSVVSGAVMDYSGLWVDNQGSTPVYGRIYAAIRQDGTALLMSFEHSPPDEFESSAATWGPLLEEAFTVFGSN